MFLSQLPNELLYMIFDDIKHAPTLNALAQSNHHLYSIANGTLYKFNARFHNNSAILWAVFNGKQSTAEWSLLKGGDINARTHDGMTPLAAEVERATDVMQRDYSMTEFLLQRGADPNISNFRTRASLRFAVLNGNEGLVRLLLQFNANPRTDRSFGCSRGLLHYAIRHELRNVAMLLASYDDWPVPPKRGSNCTVIHHAADKGQYDLVKLLLDKGEDPELKDCVNQPPLHSALRARRANIFILLLQYDQDRTCREDFINTPIEEWDKNPAGPLLEKKGLDGWYVIKKLWSLGQIRARKRQARYRQDKKTRAKEARGREDRARKLQIRERNI